MGRPGGGQPGGTLNPQSDTDQFLSYVVADIQDFWAATFTEAGRDYPETVLVLFEGGTQSGCGPASSATGPFYCPADQKVYLDLGFFDELESRFGASGGDFAMAYVVAHEFGHHIQTVMGVSESVQQQAQQDPSRQNELSVRQELQADCLAGVWAHSAASDVEPGDIEEALSAAAAVGDDRIQQATPGSRRPGVLDPRLGRAARGLVHDRLPERQRRRLRHLRGLTTSAGDRPRDPSADRAGVATMLDWAADEGWNPGVGDAAPFHEADPDGFLLGWLDGEPVASISLVRYDPWFAFLGCYIVRPPYRGQGHGLAMWRAALALREDRVVGLDGVVAQQAAYARSGFASSAGTSASRAAAAVTRPAGLVPLE